MDIDAKTFAILTFTFITVLVWLIWGWQNGFDEEFKEFWEEIDKPDQELDDHDELKQRKK